MWDATKLAIELMEAARNENPRGDLYRNGQYPVERLYLLLKQNLEEVEIAFRTGEDVGPKIGDALNYLAFMAHNALQPPDVCDHKATFVATSEGLKLSCEKCGIDMRAVPA